MADILGQLPPSYKPLQHYFQTANEHDKRDPVISYYCRLYGMQKGMELDRKSPECRTFLLKLVNYLEDTKKQYKDNESIQSEIVGSVYIENYSTKLFHYADTEDRAARFGKNVVKSFYTAAMLMDVLSNFGELSDEIQQNRRYAKWKAAYLHNCLKTGETPKPGPVDYNNDQGIDGTTTSNNTSNDAFPNNNNSFPPQNNYQSNYIHDDHPPQQPNQLFNNQAMYPSAPTNYDSQQSFVTPTQPQNPSQPVYSPPKNNDFSLTNLRSEDYSKAMKYCKFANSALQYEDSKTAIDNLTKALNLLTTGHE